MLQRTRQKCAPLSMALGLKKDISSCIYQLWHLGYLVLSFAYIAFWQTLSDDNHQILFPGLFHTLFSYLYT